MRKKPHFTHVRDNLRGDVSGKRFNAHAMERNVTDVAQERLSDGTGRIDTGHCHRVLCHRIPSQGIDTGYCHRAPVTEHPSREALPRINVTEQHHNGI